MHFATTRPPRVIHAPTDVANLASVSAHGLRELNINARSLSAEHKHRYALGPDVVLPNARLARVARVTTALARCDVLHLYGGESCFGGRLQTLDAQVMRTLRRRVVMEFVGTDIRITSVERARNPHYRPPPHADDEHAITRVQRWAALCLGHTIVADHSLDIFLRPLFDHVHVVGQRVDTSRFEPRPPSPTTDVPVVVHAPSNPLIKGTDILRRVLDELRRDGARFEYVEIHGMPQAQALEHYARADLIVDQLRVGSHGQFAVEAMSLAKPVVCYIQPQLVPLYPADLPIVNANPNTVRSVLEDWLQRPRDRHELGIAARSYAERQHDVRVVARRLLDAYEQLPTRADHVPPAVRVAAPTTS